MTTAVHLAAPEDRDRLLSLMARSHEERGLRLDDLHRDRATAPLLAGSPHGAIWLIGPQRAPLGYVILSFGWSVDLAALEGWLTDIYVRPSVRRRGIGTESLHGIAIALAQGGLRALHLRLDPTDMALAHFAARAGFVAQAKALMTDPL